jgi:hypothetical protein
MMKRSLASGMHTAQIQRILSLVSSSHGEVYVTSSESRGSLCAGRGKVRLFLV